MQRTNLVRLACLMLLAGALLVAPASQAQAADATVVATTTPGVYEFLGTGFKGNEVISTWLTGPSQQVQAGDYQKADGDGRVGFQMRIPRHFQPGRWAITMHGLDSGDEAIATFDVPVRGPDLTLTVSPASGPIGTAFAFAAAGFGANESVSYWLTGPDGKAYEGGIIQAGSDGAASFTYTIGAGTQSGKWTMSVYGWDSDHLGEATFTVS